MRTEREEGKSGIMGEMAMLDMLLTAAKCKMSSIMRKMGSSLYEISYALERTNTLTKSEHALLNRNTQFKSRHAGQRCFVIANGPSLKTQDLDHLKNEVTFVVSGFWKHPIVKEWQPTYYSIIDKNFFNGSEASARFFVDLRHHIYDTTFFVPLFRGRRAVKKYGLLPEERTFYLASSGSPLPTFDLTELLESMYSVSLAGIYAALYMGCNPIYLIGCDHDYLANRGVDRHFYEGGTIGGNYEAQLTLAESIAYDVEMENNLRLWKSYRNLDCIARKKGVQILNATNGGFLDVFPRVEYNLLHPVSADQETGEI